MAAAVAMVGDDFGKNLRNDKPKSRDNSQPILAGLSAAGFVSAYHANRLAQLPLGGWREQFPRMDDARA